MQLSISPGKKISEVAFGKEKLILRAIRLKDAEGCMKFFNKIVREGARVLLVEKVNLETEKKWVKSKVEALKRKRALTLVLENSNGEICGIFELRKRTMLKSKVDHVAEFAVSVDAKYRGKGLATKVAKILFKLGKKFLKLKLIRSSYAERNIASAKLHKKLGFKITGRIPKGFKVGRKYEDEVLVVKELE